MTTAARTAALVSALLLPSALVAQQTPETGRAHHSMYLGFHTYTTPFALEYERYSFNYGWSPAPGYALEIGLWRMREDWCPYPYFEDLCKPMVTRVPISAVWLSDAESSHHLELGFGLHLGHSTSSNPRRRFLWAAEPRFGYRYARPAGGFVFRAAYQPHWPANQKNYFHFVVGLGYSF